MPSQSSGTVRVRMGLSLRLGKSLFPVSRAKDQRLPAGPIATETSFKTIFLFAAAPAV